MAQHTNLMHLSARVIETLITFIHFLDAFFKKSIKFGDSFSDTDKFIKSVDMLKRLMDFDLLEEKKRFRLRKHITS